MKWFLILVFVQNNMSDISCGGSMIVNCDLSARTREEKRVEMPDENVCMAAKNALAGTPINAICLGEVRR